MAFQSSVPEGVAVLENHVNPGVRVLRAGVVGAGVFGRLHASKYANLRGVELTAIADSDASARRSAEVHFGLKPEPNWRSMLGRVDVVSVCSPAITHGEIVRAFLEAGAHVLVEKPIATDLDEADELIAIAEATGRVLTVGHQERFVFARAGLLGGTEIPIMIECCRAGPWTGRGDDVSVVLDLMIHDLDLMHQLVPGAVSDVRARGRAVHGPLNDEVAAGIVFENGTEAMLLASRSASERKRYLRAIYPDGTIEIDFLSREVRNTTRRVLTPFETDDPLGESIAAFVSAAREGGNVFVRPDEARRALETALLIEEAVQEAAVAGRGVPVQDEFALHV